MHKHTVNELILSLGLTCTLLLAFLSSAVQDRGAGLLIYPCQVLKWDNEECRMLLHSSLSFLTWLL